MLKEKQRKIRQRGKTVQEFARDKSTATICLRVCTNRITSTKTRKQFGVPNKPIRISLLRLGQPTVGQYRTLAWPRTAGCTAHRPTNGRVSLFSTLRSRCGRGSGSLMDTAMYTGIFAQDLTRQLSRVHDERHTEVELSRTKIHALFRASFRHDLSDFSCCMWPAAAH